MPVAAALRVPGRAARRLLVLGDDRLDTEVRRHAERDDRHSRCDDRPWVDARGLREGRDGDVGGPWSRRDDHRRAERDTALRDRAKRVRPGVDRDRHVARRLAELDPVERDLLVHDLGPGRDADADVREERLDAPQVLVGDVDAVGPAVAHGDRARRMQRGPGGGEPPLALVAERQEQRRAAGGVEPLALAELVARRGDLPLLEQRGPAREELLGDDLGRFVGLRGSAAQQADRCHRGDREAVAHVTHDHGPPIASRFH
jgi:hypothetical protein